MAEKESTKTLYQCPGCGQYSNKKPKEVAVMRAIGRDEAGKAKWEATPEFTCDKCEGRLDPQPKTE